MDRRTKPSTRNGVEIIWLLVFFSTSPGDDGHTETTFFFWSSYVKSALKLLNHCVFIFLWNEFSYCACL